MMVGRGMLVAGLAAICMVPHCATTASAAAAARGSNVTVARTCTITYPKLGCFVEQGALAYKVTSLITDMSQLACANACVQINPQYNLLGISENNKVYSCYCDQGTAAKGTAANNQCNSFCSDFTSCGGTNAISEFAFSCTAPATDRRSTVSPTRPTTAAHRATSSAHPFPVETTAVPPDTNNTQAKHPKLTTEIEVSVGVALLLAVALGTWCTRRRIASKPRPGRSATEAEANDDVPMISMDDAIVEAWPGEHGPTDTDDASENLRAADPGTPLDFRPIANTVYNTGQLFRDQRVVRAPPLLEEHQLQLGKLLGKGHFGVVRHASLLLASGAMTPVAVKTSTQQTDESANEMLQEAVLMAQLDHPNMAELVGVCLSPCVSVVMRYCSGGSLFAQLKARTYVASRSKAATLIALDVSGGMHYLSQKGFVHRDLAARNILVDTDTQPWIYKIGDFGLARRMKGGVAESHYSQQSNIGVAVRWAAPEAIMTNRFGPESDVFSFGVLCWEVLFDGALPYRALGSIEVMVKVGAGLRLPLPSDETRCTRELRALVASCWAAEPSERPSFWGVFSSLRALTGFVAYRETPIPLLHMQTLF